MTLKRIWSKALLFAQAFGVCAVLAHLVVTAVIGVVSFLVWTAPPIEILGPASRMCLVLAFLCAVIITVADEDC